MPAPGISPGRSRNPRASPDLFRDNAGPASLYPAQRGLVVRFWRRRESIRVPGTALVSGSLAHWFFPAAGEECARKRARMSAWEQAPALGGTAWVMEKNEASRGRIVIMRLHGSGRWRRDRDSNSRMGSPITRFPIVLLRPTRTSLRVRLNSVLIGENGALCKRNFGYCRSPSSPAGLPESFPGAAPGQASLRRADRPGWVWPT